MKRFSAPLKATVTQVISPVPDDDPQSHGKKEFRTSPERAKTALVSLLKRDRGAIAASWTKRHLALDEICDFVSRLAGDGNAVDYYRATYLEPLLVLLEGALVGGKPAWRAVYLDERTRFLVPAELHLKAHEASIEQVIADDLSDLVRRLALRYQEAAAEVLTALHAPLIPQFNVNSVRLLLVGDCVMTELRAFLIDRSRELQVNLHIRHQYLSFKRGVGLNLPDVTEHINSGAVDLLALSFFSFEGVPLHRALLADAHRLSEVGKKERVSGIVSMVRGVIGSIRAGSDVPILLHNASGLRLTNLRRRLPFVAPISGAKRDVLRLLNQSLSELAGGTENVVIVDEFGLATARGLREASKNLIPRKLRKRALFNTSAFGPILAQAYLPVLAAFAQLRRTKVLFVDFDNTLWSGVMADGEVQQFTREQRILVKLREAGILLVALSKNNPESIRWHEMVLQPDDFVLHKISWNQKVQSIDEVAQQLSLAIDSFAVIDDNPAERALIADRFPRVAMLDPTKPSTWDAIELMLSFPNTRETEESAARTALYRAAAGRNTALTAAVDFPVMMRTLELQATWSLARAQHLKRVQELIQRTNQFNTTTRRRTLAELRSMLTDSRYRIFVCSLADRFGDLGIVGVVVIDVHDATLVFDAVVMSCRAMGFGLETLLIRGPLEHMRKEHGTRRKAQGLFFRTDKNEPAASVFRDAGFSLNSEQQWELAASKSLPEISEWLTVTSKDSNH